MNIRNLSVKDLQRAAQIKKQIERLEAQLERILGDGSPAQTVSPARTVTRKKRKMSAAARAKIAAAQRKRWKERKAKQQGSRAGSPDR